MAIIKTSDEIHIMKLSAAAAQTVLARVIPFIKPGVTEREIADMLEKFALEIPGVTELAFPAIVASGPNGAQPHAEITDRIFDRNDMITIDFGVQLNGYASDITRTFLLGKPTETQEKIYCSVLRAQEAGLKAAKPGMACAAVDAVCRNMIEQDGYGEYFIHTTGHGVGTEVHEDPRLGKNSDTFLEPGMVVTIEPGIYIKGIGGVRIEDTVVITETGCDNITQGISKNFRALDLLTD